MEVHYILWLVAFFILTSVVSLLLYVSYVFGYRRFAYRHIPGPPLAHFIKGHAGEIFKTIEDGYPLDEYLLNCHKTYGNVILVWIFHEPLLSVTSPNLVKATLVEQKFPKSSKLFACGVGLFGARLAGHGLISNFDHENWVKRREYMNPAFHRRYLKNIMPIFNNCCTTFERKMERFANGKTKVKLLDEIGPLTLDVIAEAGYGANLGIMNHPNSPFPTAFNLTMQGMELYAYNPFCSIDFRTFPFQRKVVDACNFLRKTGTDLIAQRRRDIEKGVDVPNDILTFILKSGEKDDLLSEEDLLDELVTFFYAGHETTARTLSFCLVELAFNPRVKEKLIEEIKTVLPECRDVTMEDLSKLQYTWLCIRETLRLYPIAAGLRRYIDRPCVLGGHTIPANTDLYVSSYVSSRHPDNMEDPEEFRPERWLSEDFVASSRLTVFPFSVGYRACIGQTFAQMETKLLLSRILRKFDFELVPGHSKKITQRITIQPRDGVECILTKRD